MSTTIPVHVEELGALITVSWGEHLDNVSTFTRNELDGHITGLPRNIEAEVRRRVEELEAVREVERRAKIEEQGDETRVPRQEG